MLLIYIYNLPNGGHNAKTLTLMTNAASVLVNLLLLAAHPSATQSLSRNAATNRFLVATI